MFFVFFFLKKLKQGSKDRSIGAVFIQSFGRFSQRTFNFKLLAVFVIRTTAVTPLAANNPFWIKL